MHVVALVHVLTLIIGRQSGAANAAAFHSVGYYDCVAVEEQHQVRVGSAHVVLVPAQKRVTVDAMVPWKEPSTERRRHGDCSGAYKSTLEDAKGARAKVVQFGHLSPLSGDHFDYEVFFAVPPSGAIVLGGAPTALGARDRRRLLEAVRSSLPRNWRVDRPFVRAYRYGPASDHVIDEVYVGLPTVNPAGTGPPIKRISIRRFFLIDGRLAASEAYNRESGVEERVDAGPPELTYQNWSRSETEETVAFVSRDEGHSWERLSTNGGFEGIHWIVQSLRAGLPVLFSPVALRLSLSSVHDARMSQLRKSSQTARQPSLSIQAKVARRSATRVGGLSLTARELRLASHAKAVRRSAYREADESHYLRHPPSLARLVSERLASQRANSSRPWPTSS
jgi:hypothetical protein